MVRSPATAIKNGFKSALSDVRRPVFYNTPAKPVSSQPVVSGGATLGGNSVHVTGTLVSTPVNPPTTVGGPQGTGAVVTSKKNNTIWFVAAGLVGVGLLAVFLNNK
jgi:hypothetical protein